MDAGREHILFEENTFYLNRTCSVDKSKNTPLDEYFFNTRVIWFGEGSPKEGDRIIEWYKLEGGDRKRLSTFFTRPDLQAGPQETAGDLFLSGV